MSTIEITGLLNEDLLTSLGFQDLVPSSLAPWRPLVMDGMLFFLERLPAERLAAIVAGQLAMEENASSARRLVALLSHCPTLHKLGQVLARHRQLPPDLRGHLQSLESMPATRPLGPILARISEELTEHPPVTLAHAALAEGSVAVIVPFTYGEQGQVRHGVFKVLKPDIEERLAEESDLFGELATFLERRGQALGLPPVDYRDTLQSVQRLLAREIRLEIEQQNIRRAAAFYGDEPNILVPRLLPWCTPRLTAMERIFGAKASDAALTGRQSREMAELMISALLAQPFWTRAEQAMFHADLHGGNLLVTEDGRLAVIDWSLTAALSKAHREALVAIALGGLTLDAAKIRRAVAALGTLDADDPILVGVVEASLDRLVQQGGLPGFEWLLAMLDHLALLTPAGFQEDFALFRKSWLSLSGVIGDLVGHRSPDLQLLKTGLRQFIAEAPARLVAPPDSFDFSTHASNADLFRLWASSWLASARYWTRLWSLAQPYGAATWPPENILPVGKLDSI